MESKQVPTITKVTPSPQELKFVRGGPSTHRRDDYICTDCGGRSCGGVYSSLCTVCDGVSADPPRAIRRHYLCTECARRRRPCTCDRHPRRRPSPAPPVPPPEPRFSGSTGILLLQLLYLLHVYMLVLVLSFLLRVPIGSLQVFRALLLLHPCVFSESGLLSDTLLFLVVVSLCVFAAVVTALIVFLFLYRNKTLINVTCQLTHRSIF